MNRNIKTLEHAQFDWSDGQRAGSLRAVYEEILGKFDNSIAWYQGKRGRNRKLAWILRVSAMVVGAVAAALPTLSEMTRTPDGWWLHPGMATILGILAGVLLWLDKFIGASSAWARFTMAETALKELCNELALAFTVETGSWANVKDPSLEQTQHALALLQGFLERADKIILDETNQWKAEFQSALQQTEELAKAKAQRDK